MVEGCATAVVELSLLVTEMGRLDVNAVRLVWVEMATLVLKRLEELDKIEELVLLDGAREVELGLLRGLNADEGVTGREDEAD